MSRKLKERIEELERRVKELEARPAQIHHHYHYEYYPPVYVQPTFPLPIEPIRISYHETTAAGSMTNGTINFH